MDSILNNVGPAAKTSGCARSLFSFLSRWFGRSVPNKIKSMPTLFCVGPQAFSSYLKACDGAMGPLHACTLVVRMVADPQKWTTKQTDPLIKSGCSCDWSPSILVLLLPVKARHGPLRVRSSPFPRPARLHTIYRKGRGDPNNSGGLTKRQTHHQKGRWTLSLRVVGKRNSSIERDREQDERNVLQRELLQVLCYPHETKCTRGQVTRKIALPPKGLIKALVWFCGICGVERAAKEYTTNGCVLVTMYASSRNTWLTHYSLHTFHNPHKMERFDFRCNEVSWLFWGGQEGGRMMKGTRKGDGAVAKQRRSVCRGQAGSKPAL